MKNDRRILASILYVFLGTVLLILGVAEVTDAFWSGMGSALIAVGVIRIVQFFRFRKDDSYREKVAIEMTDERNCFLRNKAWAWSGYLFILIAAVSTLVCKLLGQDLLSMAAGFAVCLLALLYWICYLVLRKKY
jgi:hypothetical protein